MDQQNAFNQIYKIRRNLGSIKSEFFPHNPKKYTGILPIISRSKLESTFMKWCDFNVNVVGWGSESFIVLYQDPTRNNTTHRYFIDFNVTLKQNDGTLKRFLVEIKPYSQTKAPTKTKRTSSKLYEKRLAEYIRNCAKWKTASDIAKKKGMEFLVITEKNLFSK